MEFLSFGGEQVSSREKDIAFWYNQMRVQGSESQLNSESSSSCTYSNSFDAGEYCFEGCESELEEWRFSIGSAVNKDKSVERAINANCEVREEFGESCMLPGAHTIVCDGHEICQQEEEGLSPASGFPEEISTKQAIFVHSPPSQFPDIVNAKKSVFGSIFVRVTVRKGESFAKRQIPENQFDMIPVQAPLQVASASRSYTKDPVLRAFEKRGIATDLTATTASQWDVFPITKSGLFCVHDNGWVHQTRHVSKINDRVSASLVQVLKFAHAWPTGSTWTGHWDELGMAGPGTYTMPHDVIYIGKIQDGMCHDEDATLIYPNGFKVTHCNFVKGVLTDYQFQFPDGLEYEKNWKYCRYPDRRFWSEIQNGMKPGKIAQKTQQDPPRKIPAGAYDTNDGFFNEKTKMLISSEEELLRVPTCKEERWIKQKCRKGFQEFTGFRPDLFENWYNDDQDLIKSILDMQKKYKEKKITHEELYRFYEENDLLPTCYNFRKHERIDEKEGLAQSKTLMFKLRKRYEGECFAPVEGTLRHTKKLKMPRSKPTEQKLSWKIALSTGSKTSSTVIESEVESISKAVPKKHKPKKAFRSQGTQSKKQEEEEEKETLSEVGEWAEDSNLKHTVEEIIDEVIDGIVFRHREKCRDRLARTQSFGNLPPGPGNKKERRLKVLKALYESMSDAKEYCDSVPELDCDLRKLIQDRSQMVKFWGKKIFTLSFDEKRTCTPENF